MNPLNNPLTKGTLSSILFITHYSNTIHYSIKSLETTVTYGYNRNN